MIFVFLNRYYAQIMSYLMCWNWCRILNCCFFLTFSWKKIISKRSMNYFYWPLKLYLFWAWRCPKMQNLVTFFFSWQIKGNKESKFHENFNIRRQFQHFEYDMIHALNLQFEAWLFSAIVALEHRPNSQREPHCRYFSHCNWKNYLIIC